MGDIERGFPLKRKRSLRLRDRVRTVGVRRRRRYVNLEGMPPGEEPQKGKVPSERREKLNGAIDLRNK